MGTEFAFVDLTSLEFFPGKGVIPSYLAGFALSVRGVSVQVDPAVADVTQVEIFRGKPDECKRGGHAFVGVILGGMGIDGEVYGLDGLLQMAEVAGTKAGGCCFKGAWNHRAELLKHQAGGDVSGVAAAHAIGDGEDDVVFLQ